MQLNKDKKDVDSKTIILGILLSISLILFPILCLINIPLMVYGLGMGSVPFQDALFLTFLFVVIVILFIFVWRSKFINSRYFYIISLFLLSILDFIYIFQILNLAN